MARLEPEDVGLDNLRPKPGSQAPQARRPRRGLGHGKTSGRGHKGAGSRSGSKRKLGYEGGQNPIHMRMRKLRGPNKKMSMPFEQFRTAHPAGQPLRPRGALRRPAPRSTPSRSRPPASRRAATRSRSSAAASSRRSSPSARTRFSATAREKIEAAGGTAEVIDDGPKPYRRPSKQREEADAS